VYDVGVQSDRLAEAEMKCGTTIRFGMVLFVGCVTSEASARQQLIFTGSGSNEQLGLELVAIGDRNGDGVSDFAAAANAAYAPTGARVTAYSGADGAVIGSIVGLASEWFGQAIAAGDTNGDGFLEMVITSPRATQTGIKIGKVGVYPVILGFSPLWEQFSTFSQGSDFRSVAVIDDRSGDGLPDVLIGTPSSANGPRIDILAGTTGATLSSIVSTPLFGNFGAEVSAMGDIDVDGTDDYAVAAPLQAKVTIHSGSDDGVLRTITWPFVESFGSSLATLGDASGDGVTDLAIGIPDSSLAGLLAGATLIVSGATGASHQLILPAGADLFGQFGLGLADAGDLNGDGRSDLVAGSPYPHVGANGGRVRVYSGANGALLRNYTEAQSSAFLGLESVAIGDLDGDGKFELALASPSWGTSVSSNQGRIVVVDPMCGQAESFGASCANSGTGIAIQVTLGGCFKSSESVSLELKGNANASAFVVVGLPGSPLPIGNGCQFHLAGPSLSFIPVTMPAIAGVALTIPATLPPSLGAGTFAVQAIEVSGNAPSSASSGVSMTLF
jgi:FG-GAP-like repeat/FG-GAP repeat